MKIHHSTLSLMVTTLLLTSSLTQAKNINITIEGKGEVKAKEAEVNCIENCTVTNDLPTNTLVSENWRDSR